MKFQEGTVMSEIAQRVIVVAVAIVIIYWKRYEIIDDIRIKIAEEIRAMRELWHPFCELVLWVMWKMERKIDPNGLPIDAYDVESESEELSGGYPRSSPWRSFRTYIRYQRCANQEEYGRRY
jgi:hypothetical protein